MLKCHDHNSCIDKAILEAILICKANNLRFTDLRQKVFEIILKTHKPVKAYDVLSELQQKDPSAKPPTVYRALDFLLEYGLVHKIHSLNSYSPCSHPKKHNQCCFLICEKCNQIKECCDESLFKAIQNTTNSNKFDPKNTIIEISGTCNKCNSS